MTEQVELERILSDLKENRPIFCSTMPKGQKEATLRVCLL